MLCALLPLIIQYSSSLSISFSCLPNFTYFDLSSWSRLLTASSCVKSSLIVKFLWKSANTNLIFNFKHGSMGTRDFHWHWLCLINYYVKVLTKALLRFHHFIIMVVIGFVRNDRGILITSTEQSRHSGFTWNNGKTLLLSLPSRCFPPPHCPTLWEFGNADSHGEQ